MMLFNLSNMSEITKDAIFAEHRKTPKRKCFGQQTGIQEKQKTDDVFSTCIPSARKIFEAETGLELYKSEYDSYWRFIQNDEQRDRIKNWEGKRGRLVFLRDCLPLSIALNFNFVGEAGNYTDIGQWEANAKTQQDKVAMMELAKETAQVIQSLPFYKEADYICAVPAMPSKTFDLPRSVVSQVSCQIGKPDITSAFHFNRDKASVKDAKIAEKWDIWENADLSFQKSINGKTVILIDDKYQAGVTLQYSAMKLQQAGAREVYGLCFVKTWGDQDNRGR